MITHLRWASLWIALRFVLGCSFGSESSTPSSGAAHPPAPPPPPPLPQGAPTVQNVPPGAPNAAPPGIPNPFAALQALQGLAQNQAVQGPVVNWRDLAGYLPDQLGGFAAEGEIDGNTTSIQGMQVTTVKRRYKNATDKLRVEIVDTSLAPFLRAPFAMVQMIQEDSSRGYKRGMQIKGQPAIAEWSNRGEGKVSMLAAGRFLINVELDTKTQGLAEAVANALDMNGIMASADKARANATAPTGAPPAPTP